MEGQYKDRIDKAVQEKDQVSKQFEELKKKEATKDKAAAASEKRNLDKIEKI